MRSSSLLLLAALAVAGCDAGGPSDEAPTAIDLTAEARQVVAQSNVFGVGLFAQVAAQDDGNLMLAPLSASAALTMLLNGADGETHVQIRDVLGYAPDQGLDAINEAYGSLLDQLLAADPDVQLALANAVFVNRDYAAGSPFKAPFLDALAGPFDARIEALDFLAPASVGVINQWASDNTAGRVPTVLQEIPQEAVLYLLNALYFRGDWTTPFDADVTAPRDFRLADGQTVQTPTMAASVPALVVGGDGYSALELPYGRRNFSMVVVLPTDDRTLAALAADLAAGLWTDATTRLDARADWADTDVRLPRFAFSTSELLNDALQTLGMTDAFSDAADLSRMNDDPRLLVSRVKQDTFVAVDEQGTEAAAVTTVEVGATSAPPSFVADRPFVFAIRERTTNTLLFIGQVADPRS